MTDDPVASDEESDKETTTQEPDEQLGTVLDGAWAVLLATDDEQAAVAVHRRLEAGSLEAYIRDVDESDREPGEPSIQVIVPVEDASAALVELELHAGLAGARNDPGQVERVRGLGYEIDDLAIAELSATGGPQYALDELGDADDVEVFLGALEAERVRFALDRAANIVVHYNDESKVDQLIDQLFGDSDLEESDHEDADLDEESADDHRGSEPGAEPTEPTDLALDAGASDVVEPDAQRSNGAEAASFDEPVVVVDGRPADLVGPTSAISDLDGRPAVDDVTPEHGTSPRKGPPVWIYAVAVVAVVILLIVAVL